MRKQLYWLDDAQWKRIKPLLPQGRRGAHRVDDRRVISGIMHMLRSGARWRDCPTDYGPYTTVYNRFNRWSRQGIWGDIFYALTGSTGMVGTTATTVTPAARSMGRIILVTSAVPPSSAAAARNEAMIAPASGTGTS